MTKSSCNSGFSIGRLFSKLSNADDIDVLATCSSEVTLFINIKKTDVYDYQEECQSTIDY